MLGQVREFTVIAIHPSIGGEAVVRMQSSPSPPIERQIAAAACRGAEDEQGNNLLAAEEKHTTVIYWRATFI